MVIHSKKFMIIAVPTNTAKEILPADNSRAAHSVAWIQNFNTTAGFWLVAEVGDTPSPATVAVGEGIFLPPGQEIASVAVPATLVMDKPALVSAKWSAIQDFGSTVNLYVGRM